MIAASGKLKGMGDGRGTQETNLYSQRVPAGYSRGVINLPFHSVVRSGAIAAALAALLCLAGDALGQVPPPFFGGPVTAYDPTISLIDSGALLDAQAVVSNDQKYVTINARPTRSGLQNILSYPVQTANTASGFVGGVNPSGVKLTPSAHVMPSEIDRDDRAAKSVLNRRGVFLLMPLK
jgi:hypothetical protein